MDLRRRLLAEGLRIGAVLAVAVDRCLSPPPGELRDTPSPTSTPAPHV
ncbi:hypothetical protein FHT37_002774 [Mitsuaria sp. BK037]|nr:hypothetical protein [Mitsuaria sp. BK037]